MLSSAFFLQNARPRAPYAAHVIDQAIAETLDQLRANQRAHLDRRTDIERELSKIDAHKARLTDAIMQGEPVDTLLAKLKSEESRKQAQVNWTWPAPGAS